MEIFIGNRILCNHLQPEGKTPTRKSFYDALLLGCIPVIFNKTVNYPYNDLLDYSDFTVYIPAYKIVSGEVDLFMELLSISERRIKRLRENGKKVAHMLQYSRYTESEQTERKFTDLDAVDMALYEVSTKYLKSPRSNRKNLHPNTGQNDPHRDL